MDLQGNPIPPGPRSSKVTRDPAANDPIVEPSGPIANDSLAAESATSGGAFSQNRGAEPLGVSAGQSTLRTTDTSAATELSGRENIDGKERYPEALGGQGHFPGQHQQMQGNYVGGSTRAKQEFETQQQGGARASGSGYQPTDTEFPDDPKYNASFNSDIGSRNDPGRAALNKFQRATAESGPDAGYTKQKNEIDNEYPYQALDSDQRA